MIVVVVLCIVILVRFQRAQAEYLNAPSLFSAVVLIWFAPQLWVLENDFGIPTEAYDRLIAMIVLCLLAFWAGWEFRLPVRGRTIDADLSKVFTPLVVLTCISIAINLLLSRYRAEWTGGQQWSGPITIVAFFSQTRDAALALSLLLALRRPTKINIALATVNMAVSLPLAFVLLRRSEMLGIVVSLLSAFYFGRGRLFSLAFLVPIGIAFAFVFFIIGPLRGASQAIAVATDQQPTLFDPRIWSRIDISDAFITNVGKAPDLRNALYLIDYMANSWSYALGGVTWNALIKLYVPAQLLGSEFKNSLYVGDGQNIFDRLSDIYGYAYGVGTTSTGFGSTFCDFGYLGALYFFAMSCLMKGVFVRALGGSLWHQAMYTTFLPQVMLSLTHNHGLFFATIPFFWSIILAVRLLSRGRRSSLPRFGRTTRERS